MLGRRSQICVDFNSYWNRFYLWESHRHLIESIQLLGTSILECFDSATTTKTGRNEQCMRYESLCHPFHSCPLKMQHKCTKTMILIGSLFALSIIYPHPAQRLCLFNFFFIFVVFQYNNNNLNAHHNYYLFIEKMLHKCIAYIVNGIGRLAVTSFFLHFLHFTIISQCKQTQHKSNRKSWGGEKIYL